MPVHSVPHAIRAAHLAARPSSQMGEDQPPSDRNARKEHVCLKNRLARPDPPSRSEATRRFAVGSNLVLQRRLPTVSGEPFGGMEPI